jgi:hypothetical protein
MNKKYVVFTGDESGIEIDNEYILMNKQMAEITFDDFMLENNCAALYEVTDIKLILIKKEHNF